MQNQKQVYLKYKVHLLVLKSYLAIHSESNFLHSQAVCPLHIKLIVTVHFPMDWPSALFDLDLIKVNAFLKVFVFLGLFLNNTIKKGVNPDPDLVFKLGVTLSLEINYTGFSRSVSRYCFTVGPRNSPSLC